MILLADSEGPGQTAWIRRLIWAFAVSICQKTPFHMGWPIYEKSNMSFDYQEGFGV